MEKQEIFERLHQMRQTIISDSEAPMSASDNALLYDVALTLGLDERHAQILAGDIESDDSRDIARQPEPKTIDFDRGFGVGGLTRHVEDPVIPSEAVMQRIERLEETDVVCRRCGASMNFDGAMFTTGGGDVCDDCFG
jgi:hypothetical protein